MIDLKQFGPKWPKRRVNVQTAFFLALAACHEPSGYVQDFDSGGPVYTFGAQSIKPGGGSIVILGTPGDDILEGTPGDDVITGGAGNDIICGGPCPDRIPRAPVKGWW